MFIIISLLSTLFCTDDFLLFNGETNLLANRDGEKVLRSFAAVDTFLRANLVTNLDGKNDLPSFADVEMFLDDDIAFLFALAVLGLVGDTESGGLRIFT
ncbi:unnamed protein product [Lactuca saligna]|uniref:Uncharacterized protein n=1 Tax=Lactuca saligna TaxID=75948 RepID=A0AA35YAA3_LACSI|nr:unnamed protein product [Lactuca saligna]